MLNLKIWVKFYKYVAVNSKTVIQRVTIKLDKSLVFQKLKLGLYYFFF